MTFFSRSFGIAVALSWVVVGSAGAVDSHRGVAVAQAQNPCAPRNPCAAKNPCTAKNPCAVKPEVDPKLITRPAGTRPYSGKRAELLKLGDQLWKDPRLSTNGLSCQTCHQGHANFNGSFAKPYPHTVTMAKEKAGLRQIHLDEMVQICLVVPMAGKPLPWDSTELAALAAHTREVQKTFKPKAGVNPCAAKNPCAGANPCAPKR